MINVKRISHATFETPDLDRQIDYFTQTAGLALAERENGRAFLATKLGDLAVQLEKGEHARCARLAFQVAPQTEFDDIRRGIEAEGVRCQTRNDPTPGIPRMLAFEDPKGTVCEVFAAQTPIGKNQQVTGIGPIKLGHLAFVVPEPKEYAAFYTRVLGFRVSDWIQDWFVFMRCGPDHHTVNFVRGKRTQMHHIAFELKDWAHIQTACDFLGGKNIPDHLGTGPARPGPQCLHLSSQSRRPDRRDVHGTRQDAGRVAWLLRPKAVASRPAAGAEGMDDADGHLGTAAHAGLSAAAGVSGDLADGSRRHLGDRSMIRKTIGALALLAALTGAAAAQDYPNRPIKFLHGFPPGGNVDIIARLLGNEMSKGLGQSIIIEAKPGVAGSLAAETVARSDPDGYTLLVVPSAHPAHGALSKKVNYKVVDDFEWISVASFYPFLICVRKDFPLPVAQAVDRGGAQKSRRTVLWLRRRGLDPAHDRRTVGL